MRMKEDKEFLDFKDEVKQLEESFGIQVESQTQDYSPLAGDALAFTTLIFILGGIAGGLLSGAGKDLWKQLKSLSKKVYEDRCKRKMNLDFDSHHQRIFVVFNYREYQIVISSEHIHPVYFQSRLVSIDYVTGFWDEILSEVLPKLEDYIEASSSSETLAFYIERKIPAAFGAESVWKIQSRSNKFNIEEIRQIDNETYKRFGT